MNVNISHLLSVLFVDVVISNVISDRLQFLSSPACSLFHVFSAVGSTSQTSSSGDVTVLSDERPTLPELMELDIPQLVGTNYEKFGTLLLNDDTGIQVESIEVEYRGNSEKINTNILREWLKGRGSSVTWSAIVRVLRKCNLTHLADQILASKHASH